MIRIVDYGMGNLRSVQKAFERVGHAAELTQDPDEIRSADRLVLPGVGAFGAAMKNLGRLELIDAVKDYAGSGKPFLGICLGMQLLLTQSEEQGVFDGLDIISGKVVKFPPPDKSGLKVPHMGWNSLRKTGECPLLAGVPDGASVYFVHSYYIDPPKDAASAYTDYAVEFCSVIGKDNIYATQFHPEKSGAVGLRILENFAAI
ncbi:MAG: imidazole glycerol phosphate synthase subunit HisH [Armatimonadota bacterium]